MAAEPAVILADEPTANLDSKAAEDLLELMRQLNREKGSTFIFSSHDPLVISHARRVVRLRDGRLEADDRITSYNVCYTKLLRALAEFRLRKIGFIFQSYNLIPVLTAAENAEFTLLLQGVAPDERRTRIDELFTRLDIADLKNRRPGELSGGQQQRVARNNFV